MGGETRGVRSRRRAATRRPPIAAPRRDLAPQPPPNPVERRRTAVHEAGHFVVATVLPCRVLTITAISIEDDDLHAGHLVTQTHGWMGPREAAELGVVLAAGFEAEARLVGRPNPAAAVTDLGQLRRICGWVADDAGLSPLELQRSLHQTARELLVRYWRCVEALADELLEHRRIDGQRARTLVQRIRETPPPIHSNRTP